MRALAAFCLAAACTAAAARADEGPAREDTPARDYVEQVVVARVRWPVVVSPRKGAPPGACDALGPADVVVSEDGRRLAASSLDRESGPASFVFLVDNSRSMVDSLDVIRKSAAQFARGLSPQDELAVFTFSGELLPVVTPTRDPDEVARAIEAIRGGGSTTALVDAVWEALDLFDGRRGRVVVLLFSDGGENASHRHRMAELLDRLARLRDARIFVVAPALAQSDIRATAPLIWMAETTAGRVEFVSQDRDVPLALTSIRKRIANEVLVGYAPGPAAARAGNAQRVRVKIREREGVPCRVREAAPERLRLD